MPRRPGLSSASLWSALQLLAAASLGGPATAQERGLYSLVPSEIPKESVAQEEDYAAEHAAREAYLSGLASFQHGEYAEAAKLFARADDLSSSPNPKLMLGRCLRQLNKLTHAYRVLVECVEQAGTSDPLRYAKTRNAANAELEVIRDQIGLLTVYVQSGRGTALLHVAGQPIPRSEWERPIAVVPGMVKLSLETLPGVIEHREIDVLAGQTASVVIGVPAEFSAQLASAAIEPPATEPRTEPSRPGTPPLRVASYVIAGTGLAGVITFGVLGGMSAAAFDELESKCPSRLRCDSDLRDVAERGRNLQTGANVALVAGTTALATGIALFAIGGNTETAPQASVGPSGVRVRGEF